MQRVFAFTVNRITAALEIDSDSFHTAHRDVLLNTEWCIMQWPYE